MALGSYSSTGMPTGATMVGTQTPTKVFGDFPTQASQIPGMVTPNATAAMPSYVDWADIINAQNAQKAQSQASWAKSAAANQQQQQQQSQADEQAKYRAAFDEWWKPKIRNQSHDLAFALDNARGEQLRKQYANQPGGYFASGRAFNEGKVPYQGASEEQLQQQLDQMWRYQTDPYMRAVSGMDAGEMFSLGTPGKGGNMPSRRRNNGGGGGGSSDGDLIRAGAQDAVASAVDPFPTQSLTERTRPTVFY